MIDFRNIEYLKTGNTKQERIFEILTQNKILDKIIKFDPVLAGTIPINIDIENSDLDIICYVENKLDFIEKLKTVYGKENDFIIRESVINKQESIIATFELENLQFEIFGQNIPVNNQNAYRHMIIEHKILQLKGEEFRHKIIKLKQSGYKTEPAFGILLNLKEDPYLELLDYKI